jgi:hypothetical protein
MNWAIFPPSTYLKGTWIPVSQGSQNHTSHVFHVNPTNLVKYKIISIVPYAPRDGRINYTKLQKSLITKPLGCNRFKASDMNIKKFKNIIPVHSIKRYYTYSISLHGSHYKGFCIRAALSLSLLILFSATWILGENFKFHTPGKKICWSSLSPKLILLYHVFIKNSPKCTSSLCTICCSRNYVEDNTTRRDARNKSLA